MTKSEVDQRGAIAGSHIATPSDAPSSSADSTLVPAPRGPTWSGCRTSPALLSSFSPWHPWRVNGTRARHEGAPGADRVAVPIAVAIILPAWIIDNGSKHRDRAGAPRGSR